MKLAFVALAIGTSATAQVPSDIDRPWIGPQFYGNRLQDWRLHGGRIECVVAGENRPMRVMHLLTAEANSKPGDLHVQCRLGAIEPGETPAESFAGFVIGMGSPEIDYRLTALSHHRPARDGGLVVAVDGHGHITFRDFEHNENGGGWGIGGKLHERELREFAASEVEHFVDAAESEMQLWVHATPTGNRYRVKAGLVNESGNRSMSQATLDGVDPRLIDGGVGLCSHLGPRGSTSGYWFREWAVSGSKIDRYGSRTFGPIACVQYTSDSSGVRLTAQMTALGPQDSPTATLELRYREDQAWEEFATAQLDLDARTFTFDLAGLDDEMTYRVVYDLAIGGGETERHTWDGRLHVPAGGPLVVAAFTGTKHFTGGIQWNHDAVWFPHADVVRAVRWHRPDLLFFSGDQIYEGDITGAQRKPIDAAILDYLDKWYRWCWAFGELARNRPCICIPDDHDVYHGNIWGAGGRAAKRQDDGGYTMPARFVNVVQRTQTSHLPPPFDPTPVEQGIGVYYTRMRYGGVDFAVLEDRKFKSSPTVAVPAGEFKNGWAQAEGFDAATQADVDGAVLLGARQLEFLDDWASDDEDGIKVVLSQTIFANVATLPPGAKSGSVLPGLRVVEPGAYPEGEVRAADGDSNGWPQTGRNAALRRMRAGHAFHIAGDQHLGSLIRYGIDDWNDAGFAFCVPSIANTWPRRWFPSEPGRNRAAKAPRYTGEFEDGFGNKMTVLAVSNPHRSGHEPAALHDRAPGYGIVRIDSLSRTIDIECWPRSADPSQPNARQYPGWPRRLRQPAQGQLFELVKTR